jgi:hypothetical protein
MVSQNGDALLVQKEMVVINAQYGRAKVTLTTAELDTVLAQPAAYSIMRASGNLIEAVYTDAQSGARAPLDVVDSVYPQYVPSANLTIPTTEITAQVSYGGSSSSVYPDWALNAGSAINNYSPYQPTEFYSSFIEPVGAVTTIQMDLLGYTGTIKAQAAENYQSIWYNVTESTQYYNRTETIYMNVIGWHPLLRLCFNNSIYTTGTNGQAMGNPGQATATVANGIVTGVTVSNPGFGYLAPPLIEFVGEGAGAVATASISGSSISGITLISGGAGYRPVPPTMQSVQVLVSTGRVVNLKYR